MSSSNSSSSSNTLKPKWLHQVFFSFDRDDAVANSFISDLNLQLGMSGIKTFLDNELYTLASQLQAIEGSRISVVVITRSYGGSSRCMQELKKIMECHRAFGQVVLPLFSGVYSWEVRWQRGVFGKAFEELIKRTSVKEATQLSWRRALTEAACFSGWQLGRRTRHYALFSDWEFDASDLRY